MSWWTHFRDKVEKVATLGVYDPVKSRHEEADARYAINDQIKAYKDQTEITKQEIARKRGEEAVEKRRVEEKQIRSLRRNYRPPGMLGGGATPQADMEQKLGG